MHKHGPPQSIKKPSHGEQHVEFDVVSVDLIIDTMSIFRHTVTWLMVTVFAAECSEGYQSVWASTIKRESIIVLL